MTEESYVVIHNSIRRPRQKYKREGTLETGAMKIEAILDEIFWIEQNEITPRPAPSATAGDIIKFRGSEYRIDEMGFTAIPK